MKYTSAEAAKLLRKMNDDYTALLEREEISREFLASVGEDVESVRPEYDYASVQTELEKMETAIRKIRRALNVFNTTHIVPGFDMTVDEMLVFIPQLTKRKAKLYEMKGKLPKARESMEGFIKGIIDYRYTNYDAAAVAEDYDAVSEQLSKAQTALDVLNNTETLEIDL